MRPSRDTGTWETVVLKTSTEFRPKLRKRARRPLLSQPDEDGVQLAAIDLVSTKIDSSTTALMDSVRQENRDAIFPACPPGAERESLRVLDCPNRDRHRVNEFPRRSSTNLDRTQEPEPVSPRPGARSAMHLSASRSVCTHDQSDEGPWRDASLEGEEPWESVVVPRGILR